MNRARVLTIVVFGWILLHIAAFTYAYLNDMQIADVNLAIDLSVYREGGRALIDGGAVYDLSPGVMSSHLTYRYHPTFLLPVVALMQLPDAAQVVVWYALIAVGYIAGALLWLRLLRELNFRFWSYLPLFILIAYDWFGNLSYGNVGPVLVLLSGGLLWAVTRQKLAWTALLAGLILVIKPQWCFPLLYALALKQDRWFVKAVIAAACGYAGLSALFVLVTGFDRGLAVLRDYYEFVFTLQARYPWRGTDAMFNTIQNSIYQTFLRYGIQVNIAAFGTLIAQIGLLATLGALLLRVRRDATPQRALLVTLGGYIVAMCLLPQLEEALLGGVIAAALWSSYRLTRVYPIYAAFEIGAVAAVVTGIPAFFVYMTFPVSLILLLILFAGIVAALWLPERAVEPATRFPAADDSASASQTPRNPEAQF